MDILCLPLGQYLTNTYLVSCADGSALVVDPAGDPETILRAASGHQVSAILLTHGHPDHTGALAEVRQATGAPVGVHPADAPLLAATPDFALHDGQTVRFGHCQVHVHHLPGHTAGSVALELDRQRWLVGDAIFPGGPGHTDSPADFCQLIQTLRERIFVLPEETELLPGHGISTTVGREIEPFQAFLRHGWPAGACGDVNWDIQPKGIDD